MRARSHLRDLAFAGGLLLLLVLFFWPVTVGDRTMLPADVLYTHQPWQPYASPGFVTPQNSLVTDLLLENYVWKRLILECLRAGSCHFGTPTFWAAFLSWPPGSIRRSIPSA